MCLFFSSYLVNTMIHEFSNHLIPYHGIHYHLKVWTNFIFLVKGSDQQSLAYIGICLKKHPRMHVIKLRWIQCLCRYIMHARIFLVIKSISTKLKKTAQLFQISAWCKHPPKMRNLSLLQRFRCVDLPILGSPQCFSIRSEAGTVLVASEFAITEYDPRSGEVFLD